MYSEFILMNVINVYNESELYGDYNSWMFETL